MVTVVHHPDDARIRHRQIASLLAAGWQVTYAAPFTSYGVERAVAPGLSGLDLPRACGRRRLRALRAARAVLAREGPRHDVVLLHDPELLLAARGVRLPRVVWDVHEDTAAALGAKPWLPGWAAPALAAAVRGVERAAERRVELLLAEDAYARRFAGAHPVVPNCAWVPDTVEEPRAPRAVYVGHLSRARGARELVELGRLLGDTGVAVEVVGHADAESTELLARAHAAGVVRWHGFLPLEPAMERVSGSLAGLSLLHDEPNYRHSRPTKVIEYLARGVPAITTPLPLAVEAVEASGCGLVVPFEGSAQAAAEAVRTLLADPVRGTRMGAAGHAWAREHLDWQRHAPAFVAALRG